MPTNSPAQPVKLFISYVHADDALRHEFTKHLAALRSAASKALLLNAEGDDGLMIRRMHREELVVGFGNILISH
jgi:hypothetical protein